MKHTQKFKAGFTFAALLRIIGNVLNESDIKK